DDAAATNVRVPLYPSDPRAVAMDVIEHESLAQREVTQRQRVSSEAAQNGIEKDRAGDSEVGAPRIEPRHAEPLFDVGLDQPLSHPPQCFRRHSLVSQVLWRRAFFLREGDGTEAQDGSRRPNHAVKSGLGYLLEMRAHLAVEIFHQPP